MLQRSPPRTSHVNALASPLSLPVCVTDERFFTAWARAPNKRLRMAFHGSAEANMDAICREGLDPRLRAGQACAWHAAQTDPCIVRR